MRRGVDVADGRGEMMKYRGGIGVKSIGKVNRGFLIAVDGIDGGGKSTQVVEIERALTAIGLEVVVTKEPTTGPWGMKLRNAMDSRLPPSEELECFVRDRMQHSRELIWPALIAGKVVITDRYYTSTIAYQSTNGFDAKYLTKLNEVVAPKPDLLVILDIEPADGIGRVVARGDEPDGFEKRDVLVKAKAVFDSFSGDNTIHVDATMSMTDVSNKIFDALLPMLAKRFQFTD